MPGDAEELRPDGPLRTEPGVRGRALGDEERHVDERLDVVDRRRLPEEPDLDGEGGLVPRLAALALDRVEERRLLAADVGARAAPDLDVEPEAVAQHVAAKHRVTAR